MLALGGQTSLAAAYNRILNAYAGCYYDAVILQHDDLEITDPHVEAKVLEALKDPSVALVGVCGSDLPSMHWWNGNTIGHQLTDSGLLDFGAREGDVMMIEGSFMAFSPWAIQKLHFDESYDGFLGYDDVCMTARLAGKRVVVADINTHHHSTVGFKSDAVVEDWQRSERYFNEKWGAL